MRWNDVVYLISVTTAVNNLGNVIETPTKRQVFADKKSIRMNEFYQAAATGLKPELMFEIRTMEYNNEGSLEHDGKAYNIIRTYDKGGETMELICTGIVGAEVRPVEV